MRAKRALIAVLIFLVAAVAGFFVLAWRSEIAAVDTPVRSAFAPALLELGAQLAALGNCNACHTAVGGARFAGGLGIPTPFGTIYSTNITPDRDTGIGRWSEQAFIRAMREGASRDGHLLYPAFPYDHFTKMTDEDNRALYAFLMTREPTRSPARANDLRFPFNFRPLLAGWNLLFLRKGAYQPNAAQSPEWNRGAYLVEGVAHCGACHTPRNAFGAEKRDRYMAGGDSEGWSATALNGQNPAPLPWTADSLYAYLREGWDERHGAAAGPMLPVVQNMARVPEADVRAIAVYTASIMGPPSAERQRKAEELIARVSRGDSGSGPERGQNPDAAALFSGACAMCHPQSGTHGDSAGINLALSSALYEPDPRNAIHVLLEGIERSENDRGPFMPSFAGALTDEQIIGLVNYMRTQIAKAPAWADVGEQLRKIRNGKDRS